MKKMLITSLLLTMACSLFSQKPSPTFDVEWNLDNDSKTILSNGKNLKPEEIPQHAQVNIKISKSGSSNIISITIDPISGAPLPLSSTLFAKVPINFTIKNQKLSGIPQNLKYPFTIKVELEGKTEGLTLTLGDSNPPPPNLPSINLLNGLSYNCTSQTQDFPDLCNKIIPKNAILLLDCSTDISGRSILVRKSGKDKCDVKKNARYLRKGDYVKIYLWNFNPYRYNAIVNNQQIDASFQNATETTGGFSPPKSGGGPSANSTNLSEATPIKKLQTYAQAAMQLETFIRIVKESTRPNSVCLEQNKARILDTINRYGLENDPDITTLYTSIGADSAKYTKEYKQAQRFAPALAEMKLLSYDLETSILPVQVKSFDKIIFTVELKDKKTNTLVKKEEYEYLIIGGLKVDQSYGLAINNLQDEQYTLKSVTINDATKSLILTEPRRTNVAVGLSTITHFYYRAGFVNFGPSIGTMIDILPTERFRLLAGGSLMFFDGRHRISLDGGFSIGNAKFLAANQKPGEYLVNGEQLNLIDQLKSGWYIGISYNIPIIKREIQDATPSK